MDHLAPVAEPNVVDVHMRAYDRVLGLPWIKSRKPEIDWATSRLSSLITQTGQDEAHGSHMIVQWYEGRDDESTNVKLADIGGSTLTINLTSESPVDPDGEPTVSSEDSPTADIEIPRATAFDDLLASDETNEILALSLGERIGLLGATMEGTALEIPGEIDTINPKRSTSEQGAAVVVEAKQHHWILEWLQLASWVMMGVVD